MHVRAHLASGVKPSQEPLLKGTLTPHHLHATGTTGTMLEYSLVLPVTRLLSGPVEGDQQISSHRLPQPLRREHRRASQSIAGGSVSRSSVCPSTPLWDHARLTDASPT